MSRNECCDRQTLIAVVGAVDLVLSDWVLQEEHRSIEALIDALVEVIYYMSASAIVPRG